jgi:hypothetical protein
MAALRDVFTSGHVVDFILVFMAAEFGFLLWRRRSRPWQKTVLDLIVALAPGACLLLALRVALTGASWIWVAVFLALSLPAHMADLARRS